jgi:hypothetical protein
LVVKEEREIKTGRGGRERGRREEGYGERERNDKGRQEGREKSHLCS